MKELLQLEGAVLYKYKGRVHVITEPMENTISSSAVRELVREGRSLKYIVPDGVINYIRQNSLYEHEGAP